MKHKSTTIVSTALFDDTVERAARAISAQLEHYAIPRDLIHDVTETFGFKKRIIRRAVWDLLASGAAVVRADGALALAIPAEREGAGL
jgi:hypothetical protein